MLELVIFHAEVLKINCFEKFFQEHNQSVKGLDPVLSVLILDLHCLQDHRQSYM